MAKHRMKRRLLRAARFASYKAQGMTNTDAWRQITPDWESMTLVAQHEASSRFANDPLVLSKVNEILHQSKLSAMDSHSRFHADVLQSLTAAASEGNWTAVAALLRVRGSSGSYLSETFNMQDDRGTSMEQTIDRLAKLRPDMAAQLRAMLPPATKDANSDSNVVPIAAKLLK